MKLNESGAAGVVTGIMIFIIVISGVMGFIYITNAFDEQYAIASADPVNSTGIYTNGSAPYESVKSLSDGMMNSAPVAIMLAFLLAVILIVMLIWAILKKGGD